MAVLATDSFTRANNANLGTSWDVQTGQSSFKVASNAATPSDLFSDDCENYNAATWPNDQYSQAGLTVNNTAGGGAGIGLAVRCSTSAQTFYRCCGDHAGASNFTLLKCVAATFTSISTFGTGAWTDGDVFKLKVSGTSLSLWRNGVQVGTDKTDSAIDAGRAGVAYSSTVTSASLDDWEGGDLTVDGGSVSIDFLLRLGYGSPSPVRVQGFAGVI